MVIDGLSRSFAAKYSCASGTVTYGSGKEIGEAIKIEIGEGTPNDNKLYANNHVREDDGTVSSLSVSITNDGLSLDNLAFLLGVTPEAKTVTGATTTGIKRMIYTGENAPYMGYGTVIRSQEDGVDKYTALVLRRIKFAAPKITGQTQEEKKAWQTKDISGTAYRSEESDNGFYEISSELDSEADAVAYIKDALSITD